MCNLKTAIQKNLIELNNFVTSKIYNNICVDSLAMLVLLVLYADVHISTFSRLVSKLTHYCYYIYNFVYYICY